MKTLECVITDLTVTSLLFNNRKFYMSKQFMLSKSHEMNREGSNDHYYCMKPAILFSRK